MATSNSTTPNLRALENLITEITANADTVRRLCIEAINIGRDDFGQMSACIVGAQELTSLIAWKSEKAFTLLHCKPELIGHAELWLLPPSYHKAKEAAEVNHE